MFPRYMCEELCMLFRNTFVMLVFSKCCFIQTWTINVLQTSHQVSTIETSMGWLLKERHVWKAYDSLLSTYHIICNI